MSDASDFLARWSRRKQDAKRAEDDTPVRPEPTEPVPENQAAASEVTAELQPPPEAELQLSAEELAALPSIEDMTVHTDLTQFLRAGVPAPLRKAALRRMWAVDPAIRDYVGEALDYAYDWNTPGGVPGSGPLLATDDVPAMLKQILGDREDPVTGQDIATQPRPPSPSDARDGAAAERCQEPGPADSKAAEEVRCSEESEEPPEAEAAVSAASAAPALPNEKAVTPAFAPGEPLGETESRMVQRRHGGALPS